MECRQHQGEPICIVCVTCDNKLLCAECVDGHVQGHDFKSPKNILPNIQKNLRKIWSDYEKYVSDLQQSLEHTQSKNKEQETLESQAREEINHQRTILHKAIDQAADHQIEVCKQRKEKNQGILHDYDSSLSATISKLTKIKSEISDILSLGSPVEIIHKSQNIRPTEKERLRLPALECLDFESRDIEQRNIHDMFGQMAATPSDDDVPELLGSLRLQTPASLSASQNMASDFEGTIETKGGLTTAASFSSDTADYALVIHPSVPGHAWVEWKGQKEVQLTDRQGHVVQTVKFDTEIYGITTTPDNRLLVCGAQDNCIYQVLYGSTPTVYLRTPVPPRYICTTEDRGLIVSMWDSGYYTPKPNSRRIVTKYDNNGRQVACVERDSFGDRLFIVPRHVRVNSQNTTVAVCNDTGPESGHLVLLDSSLAPKLRYDGMVTPANRKYTPVAGTRFCVNDVTFSPTGDILVAEFHSRSILLLDGECLPVRTVWRDELGPLSLCLHTDGELWCGLRRRAGGVIKVIK